MRVALVFHHGGKGALGGSSETVEIEHDADGPLLLSAVANSDCLRGLLAGMNPGDSLEMVDLDANWRLVMREYRGVLIHRNTEPGCRLRWSAIGYGAADTLDGIKELIRMKQTPLRLYGQDVGGKR